MQGSSGRRQGYGGKHQSRRHRDAEDKDLREKDFNRASKDQRLEEASDELETQHHSRAGSDSDTIGREGYHTHHGRRKRGRSPRMKSRTRGSPSGERRRAYKPSTSSTSSSELKDSDMDHSWSIRDSVEGSTEGGYGRWSFGRAKESAAKRRRRAGRKVGKVAEKSDSKERSPEQASEHLGASTATSRAEVKPMHELELVSHHLYPSRDWAAQPGSIPTGTIEPVCAAPRIP